MRRVLPLCALAALLAVLPAPATAKLRAPAPQSPAAGADVEAAPALTWAPVPGADRYEVVVAADAQFGSPIAGVNGNRRGAATRNTAAALDENLADGEYFWRVRAVDERDRSGPWSRTRSFTKDWTTAPALSAPADGASVTWPAQALLLRWSTVPHATRYIVTIASEPGLANPVLGTSRDPVKTRGAQFALPGTLAAGTYYWAITPLDESGHQGQRSEVRRFTWSWPTATATRVADVNDTAQVFDPQFSWDPVPGAASYEVEVNTSKDWAPGSEVCCTDPTVGTSLSPLKILRNNVYYWRVRAVDANGNAGAWNEGPSFQKDFDNLTPSIANLRVRDRADAALVGPVPQTDSPIIAWDPVPGASSYTVQTVPYEAGACPWGNIAAADEVMGELSQDNTAATHYTYGLGRPGVGIQGPISASIAGASYNDTGLVDGKSYCVRVRARSDRVDDDNGFVSDWTQINGLGQPAFSFKDPAPVPGPPPAPFALASGSYLSPAEGSSAPRLPLFTWNPVPGASGYWIVVARDASFTTIVDYHFTRFAQYSPGSGFFGSWKSIKTYTDETTRYWWAVIPATGANGSGASTVPSQNAPRQFDKSSVPPALLAPATGADVSTQPTFRWTTSEGARRYQLQVSQDPTFGNPIDDVTTASTAYTSSTTYPADTQLYWRVGARDENDVRLNWSATGSFVRRLPVPAPAPGNPAGGDAIPALGWTPVAGAISYDVRADWVDGKTSDTTVTSTAFTPVEFYGNGVWRWKVRANFPTRGGRPVSGGYFPAQSFVRSMGSTPNVRAARTASRVLLSWDPDPAAVSYRVEISRTSGFGTGTERRTTKTTNFAPTLDGAAKTVGGTLHWRVASADAGSNQGAWTTGTFVVPKRMRVTAVGRLRRGRAGLAEVRVKDASGRPVARALVRVNGRGLRSVARRTSTKGTVRMRLTPRRAATLTVTVTRKGYRDARTTLVVR